MQLAAAFANWTPWVDIASVAAIAVSVAKMFDWFDGLISDESRVALWYSLADVPSEERIESWGAVFSNLIDRVFGTKPLTLKFIVRSCLASVVASLIVLLLQWRFDLSAGVDSPLDFLWIGLMAIASNALPDYFSLLVSRKIVQFMGRYRRPFPVFALLLLDTVCTTAIALIAAFFALTLTVTIMSVIDAPQHHQSRWDALFSTLTSISFRDFSITDLMHSLSGRNNDFDITGISNALDYIMRLFFLSSYFTSIWVWLFVLSRGMIALLQRSRPLWVKMLPYLDIEKKPMQAIGRIAGVMAGAGWALILCIAWLLHGR